MDHSSLAEESHLLHGLTSRSDDPYLEPISNASHIGTYDVLQPWEKQCEEFFHPVFMRYFLHESAHHSSLCGPVGAALSQLSYSCSSPSVITAKNTGDTTLADRDVFVWQMAWELFTPLLEGIALFQELDSIPGASACASNSTLCLAGAVFTSLLHRTNEPVNPYRALAELLLILRCGSKEFSSTKTRLLELKPKDSPYYLLGYLCVKSTYQRLMTKCHELYADTDLFISFLNDFWFSDYKLEAILLGTFLTKDHETQALVTISSLMEYFQDRWQELFRNVGEYVAEYIAYTTKTTTKEPSYQNKDFEVDAMERLFRIYGETLRPFSPKTYRHRTSIRYSVEEVTLSSDGAGNEIVAKTKFGDKRIPVLGPVPAGEYKGCIEGIFTMEYKPLAIITLNKVAISALDPTLMEWNSQELIDRLADFPSFPYVVERAAKIKKMRKISERSPLHARVPEIIGDIREMIHFVYGQVTFVRNSIDSLSLLSKLNSRPFSNLFRSLFPEVIQWSLLCGPRAWEAQIYAKLENIPWDQLLARIQKANQVCQTELGWSPFIITPEGCVGCKL